MLVSLSIFPTTGDDVYVLDSEHIGDKGVMFVAVAIDNTGQAAAGILHVKKPEGDPNGECACVLSIPWQLAPITTISMATRPNNNGFHGN